MGERHARVHLGDDQGTVPDGLLHDIHADAQAQEPVLSRRRDLDEGHVYGYEPAPDEARDLGQRDGGVVRLTAVDGIAGAVRDVEEILAEVRPECLEGVRRQPEGEEVGELGVEEGLGMSPGMFHEGLHQVPGLAAPRSDEDAVSPADVAKDLLVFQELAWVKFLEFRDPPVCIGKGHLVLLFSDMVIPELTDGIKEEDDCLH
ncbi:MAG: hypothetical protein BWX71_01374 [Deltaproteobacteria bacterium ADurb.Bin072]|nr:MAG: hypothetical protein BWX71_01374 [Deltaproteobacteria bacterium ADurb.Bin072]